MCARESFRALRHALNGRDRGAALSASVGEGKKAKGKSKNQSIFKESGCPPHFLSLPFSEYVTAEVLVFDGFSEHAIDVKGINALLFRLKVRAFKAYLIKEFFHDGV